MTNVPIYLQQGLVVLSLTSGTFLLLGYHCLARPEELDEDELATLRHIFLVVFVDCVVVGSSGWGSGEPQSACPSLSLLYHEVLLFSLLELEKHVLLSDAEMDFSLFDVDPCLGGP